MADLIVLGGCVAIEKAAELGGSELRVEFKPENGCIIRMDR